MNIKNMSAALALVFLALWTTMVYAKDIVTTDQAQAPVAIEVGNTKCPVSGQEVGKADEVVKHEYKGKIYNLCCLMCKKDFAADPEKFVKIAEDEVAAMDTTKTE